MLFPKGDFCFQPLSRAGNCSTTSFLPGHRRARQCLLQVQSRARKSSSRSGEKCRFPSALKELSSRSSPPGRGRRFRVGLSRWHSVSGVSTEPWDSSWGCLWAWSEQAGFLQELFLGGRQGWWELSSTAGENLLAPGTARPVHFYLCFTWRQCLTSVQSCLPFSRG